jgi:hypothetical protein
MSHNYLVANPGFESRSDTKVDSFPSKHYLPRLKSESNKKRLVVACIIVYPIFTSLPIPDGGVFHPLSLGMQFVMEFALAKGILVVVT